MDKVFLVYTVDSQSKIKSRASAEMISLQVQPGGINLTIKIELKLNL